MMTRYRIPHDIGMGGVSLGNEFRVTTDTQAQTTLATAWEAGQRYFDVAPHYGLRLAERRYGQFLQQQPSARTAAARVQAFLPEFVAKGASSLS